MALDKQMFIYSLGTYSFLTDEENKLHRKIQNLNGYRKLLTNEKKKKRKDELKLIAMRKQTVLSKDKLVEIKLSLNQIVEEKKEMRQEIDKVKEEIGKLKSEFNKALDKHKGVRNLRVEELKPSNVIATFDSVLTRALGMPEGEISTDIMVVESYHLGVLKELIIEGFQYSGEQYLYFASSAGQIRTKKGVWIKESVWNKYADTLTCGLSIDEINAKGSLNINKFISYKALINSASEEWIGFPIDNAIVVNDLELDVPAEVDYIDNKTYEISRKVMNVPMNVTDGVGMMLPSVSDKNCMIRLPWIKGLLSVYDFTKHGRKVTDIWNREWDIVDDKISIIFTKSQMKLWSFYDSWEDYKNRFKKYNCQAAKLNEEAEFNEGKLNYQMLQSLVDVTNEELEEIASATIEEIKAIGSDQNVMLKILGATESNERKKEFQKALMMYPALLNDPHAKQTIMKRKESLVKEAKTGKLNVNGSFTFIIPDLYAFSEYLFTGVAKSLLKKDEVYYRKHDEGKVAILRSPHLAREWGLKNNVIDDEKAQRFNTDAIYISNDCVLARLIQCDFDGDRVLVLSEHKDRKLLEVAERNMKGIVPLYYEMGKAEPEQIKNKAIYESLKIAFDANIGEISNLISKCWNSDKPNYDVIRWLCLENNAQIDFAKTRWEPTRPNEINEIIESNVRGNMPHFIKYDAKRQKKVKGRVVKKPRVAEKTNSTVNRLEDIIPKTKITFSKVAGGKLEYKLLMSDPEVEMNQEIVDKYIELDRSKGDVLKQLKDEGKTKKKAKAYVFTHIKNELLKIKNHPSYVVDVLIEYLYKQKDSKYKDTLWESFGDIILENLEVNMEKVLECVGCGEEFVKEKQRQVRCETCHKARIKELGKERQRKARELKKKLENSA
ncbi:hypothetical protein LG307_14885 [Sutcliffiella horikoshii]|uniref:hypothetical protein n=1 Tax=Sutcliffiella horikoshii TaxID=79883 RepID=UPI003850D105